MSDKYQGFTSSPIGKLLVRNLGLPNPTPLERYTEGAPLVDGTVLVGGRGRLAESLAGLLDTVGIASTATAGEGERFKGLVFDATGLTSSGDLAALREFFSPVMRSLETCPRVVVLGTPPELVSGSERVAQRALEGFTRSLGKEIGKGGTVQLVYVAEGAEAAATSTLAFLLSPKSAYVSGQVVRDRRPRHDRGAGGRRLAASPDRQGRARHRREPRHRRADRPGAAPRRRHRGRRRRAAGRQRAPGADEGAGRRLADPRHHRQGRAPADRPPPHREARRRRRRRAQRRHHPRQEARQHGRGPLGLRDRGQPDRSRADHPRAALAGRRQRRRLDRRRRLHRGHRRQRRPDQLRRLQGRRDRLRRLPGRRARPTASRSTPSRRASSSPR